MFRMLEAAARNTKSATCARFSHAIFLWGGVVTVFCFSSSASAQSSQPPQQENPYSELAGASGAVKTPEGPAKPAPRAADGKPDLSGFWKGPLIFGGMFKGVGGPPFTPEGKAAYEYNLSKSINPEALCLFAGIPRASIS